MADKLFISPESLLLDSYKLARKVLDSGFQPSFLIGIWRGGTPVGIAVQEYLAYHGVQCDHSAIRTSAYPGLDQRSKEIKVDGLDYVVRRANAEDRILFVDDVYDSGLTIQQVISQLEQLSRKNTPQEIKIATVYYKPERNKTHRLPDYYINKTDKWLVFPHELRELTEEEIRQGKGEAVWELLQR